MIGVELVKTEPGRSPLSRRVIDGFVNASEKGLLVLGCGASTLRLMPLLMIEPEQADIALQILDGCLTEVEAGTTTPKTAKIKTKAGNRDSVRSRRSSS